MTDKPILISGLLLNSTTPVHFNAACIVDMTLTKRAKPPGASLSDKYVVRYAVGDGEIVTVNTNRFELQSLFSHNPPMPEKLEDLPID